MSGYDIVCCAFDDCDWQAVDGPDRRAYRHLLEEHPDALARLWRLGRPE